MKFTKIISMKKSFVILHESELLSYEAIAKLSDTFTGIGFEQVIVIIDDNTIKILNSDATQSENINDAVIAFSGYHYNQTKNNCFTIVVSLTNHRLVSFFSHIIRNDFVTIKKSPYGIMQGDFNLLCKGTTI